MIIAAYHRPTDRVLYLGTRQSQFYDFYGPTTRTLWSWFVNRCLAHRFRDKVEAKTRLYRLMSGMDQMGMEVPFFKDLDITTEED